MIRIFLAIAASAIALFSASCGCCTGEPKAPGLRALPQFQEIQSAGPEVHYSK
jgi:hypothetical protein